MTNTNDSKKQIHDYTCNKKISPVAYNGQFTQNPH